MQTFEGDLSGLWRLQDREPIHHLTWDWWWWLVMLEDEGGNPAGKQLMVLWSTKDNPLVEVNGVKWQPVGRPGVDDDGGIAIEGMVAAWWYDGKEMHEPLVLESCRIIVVGDSNPQWPGESGGAVVAINEKELSMGLKPDLSEFWLRLETEHGSFDLAMSPWNPAMSTARQASAIYAKGMGYDILRLHGSICKGKIAGKEVKGSAYFQKVCVQAPSIPWFWGVLHLDDGSYIDWFVPHLSPLVSVKDSKPNRHRDITHFPLSQGGLFHDVKNQRSESFSKVTVERVINETGLPVFYIHLWNGRSDIRIEAEAVSRAHWTFDQPTRGGIWSHLTYNEYPLKVNKLAIKDETGARKRNNWGTIHGNAEHSWGLLH